MHLEILHTSIVIRVECCYLYIIYLITIVNNEKEAGVVLNKSYRNNEADSCLP